VNCPAPDNAVTATIAISTGCVKTSFHARMLSAGGRTPLGTARQTQAAVPRLSTATSAKAQRQPKVSPM
jgi:hypothetical protein